MNHAVIYCRVSTKEQVENFSLATQEKACRQFCASHAFDVDKVFVEEGESAKTANRTEFQKMLSYEKAIDRETYQRQLDKLNQQITLAEMEERDAKLESYDVEAVLNFAEHVILNAARLWTELASEAKQRLQKVLFPQGVTFAEGNYKTAETCLFFKLLQESEGEKTGLVPPSRIERESTV